VKRLLLAVLLLTGCDPTNPVKAGRWTTIELAEGARTMGTAGGFPSALFVTPKGGPLPFRAEETPPALAAEAGWSVLPAYALGQSAAYVVSEVWESHPDPWVQPVYVLVTSLNPVVRPTVDGARVPNVFGVGADSTFYSPFWQGILVQVREVPPKEGLPDTRAVLAAATQTQLAGKPLCPITPDGFVIASTHGTPVHPFTGAEVKPLFAGPVRIDGATPSYIDFGADKFEADDSGLVLPTRIFFFTRMIEGVRTLLELPAVLADNAARNGYARRHDVILGSEAIFVPPGAKWDAVRKRLDAPPADPNIPAALAASYALRVAKTGACFGAAASFPAGCEWVDSEAAIDRLEPRRVVRTEVTMTAVPVLFDGAKL
jgi:hypothetical protein